VVANELELLDLEASVLEILKSSSSKRMPSMFRQVGLGAEIRAEPRSIVGRKVKQASISTSRKNSQVLGKCFATGAIQEQQSVAFGLRGRGRKSSILNNRPVSTGDHRTGKSQGLTTPHRGGQEQLKVSVIPQAITTRFGYGQDRLNLWLGECGCESLNAFWSSSHLSSTPFEIK